MDGDGDEEVDDYVFTTPRLPTMSPAGTVFPAVAVAAVVPLRGNDPSSRGSFDWSDMFDAIGDIFRGGSRRSGRSRRGMHHAPHHVRDGGGGQSSAGHGHHRGVDDDNDPRNDLHLWVSRVRSTSDADSARADGVDDEDVSSSSPTLSSSSPSLDDGLVLRASTDLSPRADRETYGATGAALSARVLRVVDTKVGQVLVIDEVLTVPIRADDVDNPGTDADARGSASRNVGENADASSSRARDDRRGQQAAPGEYGEAGMGRDDYVGDGDGEE